MLRFVALWAALAACGCGDVGEYDGSDGTPPSHDAGFPQEDAPPGEKTGPIEGAWRFIAGASGAQVRCDVEIRPGTFDVLCHDPDVPRDVAPECRQVVGDLRLHGRLGASLDGSVDSIERYEGDGCASASYPTGIDVVSSRLLVFDASRTVAVLPEGFWGVMNGTWDFQVRPPGRPAEAVGCTAVFSRAGEDTGWSIRCPVPDTYQDPPGCTVQIALLLDGRIGADGLEGELVEERSYDGTTCQPTHPEPIELGDPVPLSASRK